MSDLERIKTNSVIRRDSLGYSDALSLSHTVQLSRDKSLRSPSTVALPIATAVGSVFALLAGLWWIAAVMLPVMGFVTYKNVKSSLSLNGAPVSGDHRDQLYKLAFNAEIEKIIDQQSNQLRQEEREMREKQHQSGRSSFSRIFAIYDKRYTHGEAQARAESSLRDHLSFPKVWNGGTGLMLSEGIPSMDIPSVYAIKRADRTIDIVEQRFIAEDDEWMNSFEKALDI